MYTFTRVLTGRGEGLAPVTQCCEHLVVLLPREQDRGVRLRGRAGGGVVAATADVGHVGRGVSGRHPHEIRMELRFDEVQIRGFLLRDSLNLGSSCHVAF